jgi:hypothetical protein
MIPGDAVVSADYRMVTHLTHRVEVYEFPNPFYVLNWGGRPTGTAMPDIEARVQYVLVSRGADARSQLVLQRVLDSGDFESIFDREGLRLLKRARSAAAVPGINGIGGAPQASVARRQSQT